MAFSDDSRSKLKYHAGRTMLYVRYVKILAIFAAILWACQGALEAVLRDDHVNCFLALFGASAPTYILSLHLVSVYKKDWKRWPIRVLHIHIYANAFLGMLTAFAFTCCVVVYILLDTRRFDANSYAESAAWLLYAFVWQIIVGTTLKAIAEQRYKREDRARTRKWRKYTRYVELKRGDADGEFLLGKGEAIK